MARRRVVDAVLALAEPYRTALVLRYLEELPPRAVASRLGVPVETVRTRVKRALELLRERLAASDRGKALSILLPLLRHPASHAALGGLVLMGTKVKVAMAAAVALSLAWWFWPQSEPASPITAATAGEPPGDTRPAAPITAAAQEPGTEAARTAAGDLAAAPATTGSLVVKIVWADDKSPAADIGVETVPRGSDLDDSSFAAITGRTDAQGAMTFSDLPPGRRLVLVQCRVQAHKTVEVVAGRAADCPLELARACTVHGEVVDGHDAPVPNADVLGADWTGSRSHRLARADARGRFEVRGVVAGTWIGAAAAGFATSPFRSVFAKDGARVELRLRLVERGAALRGSVVGADGKPRPGLWVVAGEPSNQMDVVFADGSRGTRPRPTRTRTDGDGRFVFDGLPAGRTAVYVRVLDAAPWVGNVELRAGESTELRVRLDAGCELLGTVRARNGEPVAGARIDFDAFGHLIRRTTSTAADGAFRLTGLPAGVAFLSATHDAHGEAREMRTLAPAEPLRWDVTFAGRVDLDGIVLDERGQPLADARVELQASRSVHQGNTDAKGQFVVRGVPAERVWVQVTPRSASWPVVHHEIDAAAAGRLELRLPVGWQPSVRIQGRVVDAAGQPLTAATAHPAKVGARSGVPILPVDAKTGAFDLGPYPPGSYDLRLNAPGHGPLSRRKELATGEVWDLGVVQLGKPAVLEVRLRCAQPDLLRNALATLFDAEGGWVAQAQLTGGSGRTPALAAGDYTLIAKTTGHAAFAQRVSIAAGETKQIEITLEPAAACKISLPPLPAPQDHTRVWLRDAAGHPVDLLFWSRARGEPQTVWLRPGRYELVPVTGGRPHAFTVEEGRETSVRVESF